MPRVPGGGRLEHAESFHQQELRTEEKVLEVTIITAFVVQIDIDNSPTSLNLYEFNPTQITGCKLDLSTRAIMRLGCIPISHSISRPLSNSYGCNVFVDFIQYLIWNKF